MFGANSYGATPIQLAIESGCQKTIEVLLNSYDNKVFKNVHNESQQTLAHLVSLAGQTHVAEYLVKHSVNWNVQDIDGNTPLHLACNKNNTDIVKLIAGHCTVTIQNKDLKTPIHIAVLSGKVVILDALLEGYSGSLDEFADLDGNTALHSACQSNNDSSCYIVKRLCDYCSLTVENKEKSTPMHFACKFGNFALVDHLFKRYSSLHLDCLLVDDDENTILHVAVENSASLEVVTVVSNHISPVHKNKQGETSIHIACRNGDLPIVRLLVTKAAELVFTDSDDSYLHSACCGKSLKVVMFLVEESGLAFDRLMNTNNDGNTPLHCAFITGIFEIISYLMRYANLYTQNLNKEGLTPY
ncbi:receptor-interacting serine/threonine-protein kinase 4-like [Halichondria panicea]|uniref:receptor-interacting serine/threonine-protein kinase 4-like n=1 Tax=Halichondria panicea TaxID=6063 RepID=UPI00312B8493